MNKLLNKDSILGLFVLVISIFLMIHTKNAEKDLFFVGEDISPFLIPSYYLYMAISCGIYFIFLGFKNLNEEKSQLKHLPTFLIVIISLISVYLMETLGFLIVMPISVYLCALTLGYRNYKKLIIISLCAVLFVWFALTFLGNMPLPTYNWE